MRSSFIVLVNDLAEGKIKAHPAKVKQGVSWMDFRN